MRQKKYKSTGGVYAQGYQRSSITTTNMSKNESFERNGYLFCPGLIKDVENLFNPPPVNETGKRISGSVVFTRKDKFNFSENESQVPGSFARYNIPTYKELHYFVKKEIENILGMELFPTYFYDRFYYCGQQLQRHTDRPACEVSVSLQISSNSKEPWPIWFERPDGSESYVLMQNGDAVIYKGCERDHWRDPLQSKYNKWQQMWRSFNKKEDDTYHHQIFLHYVNSRGPFVHHAFDSFDRVN